MTMPATYHRMNGSSPGNSTPHEATRSATRHPAFMDIQSRAPRKPKPPTVCVKLTREQVGTRLFRGMPLVACRSATHICEDLEESGPRCGWYGDDLKTITGRIRRCRECRIEKGR